MKCSNERNFHISLAKNQSAIARVQKYWSEHEYLFFKNALAPNTARAANKNFKDPIEQDLPDPIIGKEDLTKPLNVLYIYLDAMGRRNFHRLFPKTVKVCK